MVPRRIKHYPRTDGPCPAGVKWVGRPGPFGNPHPVGKPCWRPGCDGAVHDRAEACRRHEEDFLAGRLGITEADVLELARFEALACACPEDETPCHADLYVRALRQREEIFELECCRCGDDLNDGEGLCDERGCDDWRVLTHCIGCHPQVDDTEDDEGVQNRTPEPEPEDFHHAGCTGCIGDYRCDGCGHLRDDLEDYTHGFYCVDCVIVIENWRRNEQAVAFSVPRPNAAN